MSKKHTYAANGAKFFPLTVVVVVVIRRSPPREEKKTKREKTVLKRQGPCPEPN